MPLPARLQHMAQQKKPCQRKAVAQVVLRPSRGTFFALAQKGRQPQQPVVERRAGIARHRATRFRRHVDEIGGRTRRRAGLQIKPEAEFGEHREFKPDQMRGRAIHLVEIIQHVIEHLVNVFVRVALGQQPRQRSKMGHAIDRVR
jgi:hypothetical protein